MSAATVSSSIPSSSSSSSSSADRLLEHLVQGTLGPLSRLTEAIDLTLDQIIEWMAKPQNQQRIGHLATLLNAQAQLLACQCRIAAIAKLAEITQTSDKPETARRACMDLLKVCVFQSPEVDESQMAEPALSEEELYRVLDRLGEKSMASAASTVAKPQAAKGANGENVQGSECVKRSARLCAQNDQSCAPTRPGACANAVFAQKLNPSKQKMECAPVRTE
jgi:hypothetical protein